MNIAIIFAGGSGVRMGAGLPKQFLEVNGKPILIHTMQLFQRHMKIDKIYAVVSKDYIDYVKNLAAEFHITKLADVVCGGETAQDSIYNGLMRAAKDNPMDSIVLIHDGVRPFVAYDVISRNIKAVKKYGNAITSTPCFETIMVSKDGDVVDSVPCRKETFAGQAPQSFYLGDIIDAHNKIRATETGYENMVDACTIIRTLGITAHMVEGNRGNIKITTPEDVYMLRALFNYQENEMVFGLGITDRIGHVMPGASEDSEDED